MLHFFRISDLGAAPDLPLVGFLGAELLVLHLPIFRLAIFAAVVLWVAFVAPDTWKMFDFQLKLKCDCTTCECPLPA